MLPELWTMPGTGWPLKSYGFMMMIGFLSGVYLAMRRAVKVKCDPDVVLNCSFIALIAGVGGARFFYVVHYWDEAYAFLNPVDRVWAIINITQGGLEFVGGLLTAALFILIYLGATRRSVRVYTDILAVSTMWALGIARIGCFLNGCCFGGTCADEHGRARTALAVEFPFGSPAFVRQWERRQFTLPAELIDDRTVDRTGVPIWENMPLGRDLMTMSPERRQKPRLRYEEAKRAYENAKERDPNSDETGSLAGELEKRKAALNRHKAELAGLLRAQEFPSREDPSRSMMVSELQTLAARNPALPVHPTQLYATVSAVLLSILLGRLFHRRKRHGIVFAWMLILYPVSRFLLEEIRTDNPVDTFGMTVSQAVGMGVFLLGCLYLLVLYRFFPERSPRAIPFVPEEEEDPKAARTRTPAWATPTLLVAGMIVLSGCAPTHEVRQTHAERQTETLYTDVLTGAPHNVSLLLENQYVRVMEFNLRPGDRLPTHCVQCRVVIALTDYDVLYESPDGSCYRAARRRGAGDWHETGIHAIENVGDSDARYLVVARSAVALPPTSPDEFTPRLLEVAGDQARVLLENDAIRVLDVSLPMNDTLPRHYGGHRVVYSLTSSELLEMCENTGSAKTFCRAGQAHWQDAGVQTIKNVGRLAHILVFELKR